MKQMFDIERTLAEGLVISIVINKGILESQIHRTILD